MTRDDQPSDGGHSPDDEHLIWTEIETHEVLDAHIFSVRNSLRRAADGAEATYTLVDSPDWCNVIATTIREDGVECVVMVRQYRHGNQMVTMELPGGVVDPGEDPAEAASRELLEETGYSADSVTLIGRANPNPAFMNNLTHTFVAPGVQPHAPQRLDDNERVDPVLYPVDELINTVPPDFHVHAIMLTALYWYRLYIQDGLTYPERLDRWQFRD